MIRKLSKREKEELISILVKLVAVDSSKSEIRVAKTIESKTANNAAITIIAINTSVMFRDILLKGRSRVPT